MASTATRTGTITRGQVRLRLLGEFGLTVDGNDRSGDIPVRARSLLAYLVLHAGQPCSRQQLAFRLWPDSTDAQARTNLRNVLHHLRRAAPEFDATIAVTPSTLCWIGAAGVEVDVLTFLDAVASATEPASDEPAALRQAADEYRGDLLEGCYEEWIEADRARLSELMLAALRRLAAASLGRPDAIDVSRRLVQREPLNEENHRLAIAAHAALGDRAGAVRAYQECADTLAVALGIEPSEPTRRVYAHALGTTPDTTPDAVAPAIDAGRVAGELVPTLPGPVGLRLELRMLALLPAALQGVDGYASDRMAAALTRADTVAAELGVDLDPTLLRAKVLASLCRDEFAAAAEAAGRLMATAEQIGDEGLAMESGYLLGIAAFWQADLDTAVRWFREVDDGFPAERRADHLLRFGQDPQAVCRSRLANALCLLDRSDEARDTCTSAIALANQVGDPMTVDVVHVFAGMLAVDIADPDLLGVAVAHFGDGRPRSGPSELASLALIGYADVVSGHHDIGLARIAAVIDTAGGRNMAPGFLACLHRLHVGAHAISGSSRAGLAAADRALDLGSTCLWEPEILRVRELFASRV